MNKSRNLCFERNPEEIADVMNGCDNIGLSDCVEAIIGLGRIAATFQAQVSNLQTEINTLKRKTKKGGDQVDSVFTVDQMRTIINALANKMAAENFQDKDLTYKIDRLSNSLEKAVERHGNKKEKVNIVLVIW